MRPFLADSHGDGTVPARRRAAASLDVANASIVVGPAAERVRREVGPVGWCVLELLVALPPADDDNQAAVVVGASVRAIASRLGISKDTAQRAMSRLSAAGLLVQSQRRSDIGQYAAGTYRLSIPSTVLAIADARRAAETPASSHSLVDCVSERVASLSTSPAERSSVPGRSRSRRSGRDVVEQLSLVPGV